MKKNLLVFILMLFFVSLFAENEMIFVEGGNMILGTEEYKRNQPHNVTLSDFYIAKYLVTMGEFKDFLTDTKLPFSWDGRITSDYLSISDAAPTDRCPAQGMTWLYAVLYCNWLSEKENLIPCYEFPNGLSDPKIYVNMRWNHKANGYRLPTEAEWEYAAQGGQLSKGYKYPGSDNLNEVNKESAVSYEIGQMKANELGIHDMGGLVGEYCYDWYDEKMWEWLPQENPCFETLSMVSEAKLPKVSDMGISQLSKVFKGADRNEYTYASSYNRFSLLLPHSSTVGIRLVRNYDEKSSINSNVTKTDFNSYEEKQDKQVTLVISKDGTVINNYYNEFTPEIIRYNSKIKEVNDKYGYPQERQELKEKQAAVIANPNYQQGSQGPFGFLEATSETTWCNMATQEVTFETSYELSMALRNENDPYCENTNANDMYDNLMKAALDPNSSIVEVTPEQAQILANMGYTVAGSWKSQNPKESGHIATVESGYEYDPETGPYFGNVGDSRYTGTGQKAIEAFGKDNYQSIKYYYDKEQFKNRRWY